MKISAPIQFYVHHSPQASPKIPKELSISIRDNRCGQPKGNPNMLKKEMSSLLNGDLLFAWHRDTHLVEPIHYEIQIIMTPSVHW
jgi:hypothetical protein